LYGSYNFFLVLLQIQHQQLPENLLITKIGLPPLCREDCFVKPLVGEIEPGGTLVI
jgi:hypothetical protein